MLPDSVVRDHEEPPAEAYCTVQPARLTVAVPPLNSSTKSLAYGAPLLPPPPYTWLTTTSAETAEAGVGAATSAAATSAPAASPRITDPRTEPS